MLRATLKSNKLAYSGQGLLAWGKQAAGDRTIVQLLQDIARNDTHTNEEQWFIKEILWAILEGEDVAKALRIDRPKAGHRKASPLARDIALVIDELLEKGFEKNKGTAIKWVAATLGMEVPAVRQAYKVGKGQITEK